MKKVNLLAFGILAVMAALLFGSVWHDAATFDEVAHIPAGYSYVTKFDYRLNPEHPPLIKALAGISAQIFVHPYFPTNTAAWRDDINGQWAQGAAFLYEVGNNSDAIIFWSRVPIMRLSLFCGLLIFWWTKRKFGALAAVLTLLLYAFSPTVLAHSRYVTTDLGAAFGFFISTISILAFLKKPSWGNAIVTGIAVGVANLFKFSLVLIFPMFFIMFAVWIWAIPFATFGERIKNFFTILGKSIIAGFIALGVIWAVYAIFIWNYPPDRQYRDADVVLSTYGYRPAVNFDLQLIQNPITRPLGQYLFGVLMAQQRSEGGNTTYFLGEVTAQGSRRYFPLMYLVKESLAFHILTLIALWYGIKKIIQSQHETNRGIITRVRRWSYDHFTEMACMIVIGFYWIFSMKSALNIGVRHVLPTFPFLYILVSRGIAEWIHGYQPAPVYHWFDLLRSFTRRFFFPALKLNIVGVLVAWMIVVALTAFPFYLSYYNALGGGTTNGYLIATDSNYDWGQDLYRLKNYVDAHDIQKIALDYFGGGSPRVTLSDVFEPWWSAKGAPHGWFAISSTLRQGAFGAIGPGFIRKPEDSYDWLRAYTPVDRAGASIFIYKLP